MKDRTHASRTRAWAVLVVATLAMFQLQLVMTPVANASSACNGAFSGNPSGTLALSASVPNGGSISAGQSITITASWDTSDWTSLDAYYNCFLLNGSAVGSLEYEEKPPTNDGSVVQVFSVPNSVVAQCVFYRNSAVDIKNITPPEGVRILTEPGTVLLMISLPHKEEEFPGEKPEEAVAEEGKEPEVIKPERAEKAEEEGGEKKKKEKEK